MCFFFSFHFPYFSSDANYLPLKGVITILPVLPVTFLGLLPLTSHRQCLHHNATLLNIIKYPARLHAELFGGCSMPLWQRLLMRVSRDFCLCNYCQCWAMWSHGNKFPTNFMKIGTARNNSDKTLANWEERRLFWSFLFHWWWRREGPAWCGTCGEWALDRAQECAQSVHRSWKHAPKCASCVGAYLGAWSMQGSMHRSWNYAREHAWEHTRSKHRESTAMVVCTGGRTRACVHSSTCAWQCVGSVHRKHKQPGKPQTKEESCKTCGKCAENCFTAKFHPPKKSVKAALPLLMQKNFLFFFKVCSFFLFNSTSKSALNVHTDPAFGADKWNFTDECPF